jgi:AraC-like DNA-binding protein
MKSIRNEHPLPEILQIETHDPGEICDLVPVWDQEYTQLKRGQYHWENYIIQIGDFQFIEERFGAPTLVKGCIEKGKYAIEMTQLCLKNNYYCGSEISFQMALLTNSKFPFGLKIKGELKHILMVVPVDQILALVEKSQISFEYDEFSAPGLLLPNPVPFSQLNGYLNGLFSLAKSNPSQLLDPVFGKTMAQLVIADTLPLFVDLLSTSAALDIPLDNLRYEKLTKQVDTMVRAVVDRPITLQQICENVETSPRSLNYAFQAVYGLSPMEYLKILRLNQVRWALRKADPTQNRVSGIANRFGFWHMGQFGADYKKMFGETPSTTLKLKR